MRRQLEQKKEKYTDFLTLEQIVTHPNHWPSFKDKLLKRLAQHCKAYSIQQKQVKPENTKTVPQQPSDQGILPVLDDKPDKYLEKGRDVSKYVDLQLDFSNTEFNFYRIDLKYYYRDDPDKGSHFATGRIEIPWFDAVATADVGRFLDVPLYTIFSKSASADLDLSDTKNSSCDETSEKDYKTLEDCLIDAIYRADELKVPLQLRIGIKPGAGELNELHWEELELREHHGQRLCSQQGVLFSRIAISGGDEPVESQTRTGTAPWALCIYSDAGRTVGARGDTLKFENIVNEMEAALNPLTKTEQHTTKIVGPNHSMLCQKLEELDSYDILYMACEATCHNSDYHLHFEGGDISRANLARRLRYGVVPRLVVLIPTYQLDDIVENKQSGNAILHFASIFAQLGAAAVLTCSAKLAPKHWYLFFNSFIEALAKHGHIVGAAAQARQELRGTDDWWKPVLITRIKAARLWYQPGFVSSLSNNDNWERLKNSLEDGKLCPVLGSGFYYRIEQIRSEIAREMAGEYAYPLSSFDRIRLPAIAQYVKLLAGGEILFFRRLKDKIRDRWQRLNNPSTICVDDSLHKMAYKVAEDILKKQPDNPYNLVARIQARLYLTTNLDPFIEAALDPANSHGDSDSRHNREAYQVFNFSNVDISKPDTEEEPVFKFSAKQPLIVQFYGSYKNLEKAVITEDDLLEFLRTFNERIKGEEYGALTGQLGMSDLVFLGFKWNSLEFRVLFRALQKYANSMPATSFHIAVQIDPDDDETLNQEKALEYLQRYLSGEGALQRVKISIYLGSTADFLKQFLTWISDCK